MNSMDYSIHLVLLIFLTRCIAVNIRRLEVPSLVRLGHQTAELDCDYTLGSDPRGLVIKWFFNNKSNQVYQWIPPIRPQDLGLLKGKIDLDFRISDEPLLAHRALRIINPTTEMSGNYTCVVSTFEAEDHQSKSMLVYSPGHNFQFVQEKKYVFLVTLICFVEDVYPKPVINILSQGEPLKDVKLQTEMDARGLYDAVAKAVVHDDDLPEDRAEFVCQLSLPSANYSVTRSTVYYPGQMPTAQLAAVESAEKSLDHHRSNGSVGVSASIKNVMYVIAIFYNSMTRLN